MNNIEKYTKLTTVQQIINDVLWQSYSKYSELSHTLLENEIDIVDNALRQFVEEIGIIKTKNKKFKLVCFENYPSYIKFYNLDDNNYINYYDLKEIDIRYIDIVINKWLEK
jgi:hypothetical protein